MRSPEHISVLVVEDVKAMRIYFRAMLDDGHIEIAEAASLQEARSFLRSTPKAYPDFVLLDLELPDGHGLDLMPEIDSATRVIALTADVERETELQCQKAGCDVLIQKSQELSSLRGIVTGAAKAEPLGNDRDLDSCLLYITYLAETRVALETARSKSDFLTIRQIAHRLRGTAVHFGYPGIGSAAKSISTALAAGRLDQLDRAASTLCARIGDAIESHHRKTRLLSTTEVSSCES